MRQRGKAEEEEEEEAEEEARRLLACQGAEVGSWLHLKALLAEKGGIQRQRGVSGDDCLRQVGQVDVEFQHCAREASHCTRIVRLSHARTLTWRLECGLSWELGWADVTYVSLRQARPRFRDRLSS